MESLSRQLNSKKVIIVDKILEVKNLTKKFGALAATDNVSFDMENGELAALIGPNGAGKTTLFSLLTGKLKPDSGKVVFKGEDITSMSIEERVRKGLGHSFQIVNLFNSFTSFENVTVPVIADKGKTYDMYNDPTKSEEIIEKTKSIIGLMSIDNSNEEINTIPHGEKTLTDIAVSLASSVDLLLLDEPTAGIGTDAVDMVKKVIKTLNDEGTTILFTEHDLEMVYDTAHRIIVEEEGRIIADGSTDEVKQNERVKEIYG